MTERDETGIELLLSEPEIAAWLELPEPRGDDDEVVRFPRGSHSRTE